MLQRFALTCLTLGCAAWAQTDAGPVALDDDGYPTLDALFSLYQPYMINISAYEPIYFLFGADPEDSKFQFSLKYRPFDEQVTATH